MTRREPSDEAILAARLQRAYPSLSPYSSASLAQQLCAIERMQRRHAERCCSGEDGGYTKQVTTGRAGVTSEWNSRAVMHDPDAEERAGKRINATFARWRDKLGEMLICADGIDATFVAHETRIAWCHIDYEVHGDPRGAVLKVRLPGEAEAVSV